MHAEHQMYRLQVLRQVPSTKNGQIVPRLRHVRGGRQEIAKRMELESLGATLLAMRGEASRTVSALQAGVTAMEIKSLMKTWAKCGVTAILPPATRIQHVHAIQPFGVKTSVARLPQPPAAQPPAPQPRRQRRRQQRQPAQQRRPP